MKEEKKPVLKIEDMSITFSRYERGSRKKETETIHKLSLEVREREVVAIVGASGSGKSLLAHAVLGILPYNAVMSGKLWYRGEELTKKRQDELRGSEIVLVPQSISYLDPLLKLGPQICKGRKDARTTNRLKDIFSRYHLKDEVAELYPFELSGGMNRRILVSTAMIEEPKLVIADEPTPGLDLKTARRVMSHFRELAEEGAGVLVITHDLELAIETADRIVVFYDGNTIEEVLSSDFEREENLSQPYTKALFRALPGNGMMLFKTGEAYEAGN